MEWFRVRLRGAITPRSRWKHFGRARIRSWPGGRRGRPAAARAAPDMAEIFRHKTMQLAAAPEQNAEHDAARQKLRGLIDRSVTLPGEGPLQVAGNLGEMLAAARPAEMRGVFKATAIDHSAPT